MDTPVLTIALISVVVLAAAYLLHYLNGRRHADFDGGVVSQSWLMEHRSSTQDDRFS